MSDTRRMLAEMVDPLFAGMGAAATVERDIARLEELGLPNLLVPEAEGGFGGTWLDALTVFRLAGYHALGIHLPKLIVKRAAVADTELAMAFARACQIAGALDAALALSIAYANERQQFGRPLGKFQAVQQSLASFACEAAAANCAAMELRHRRSIAVTPNSKSPLPSSARTGRSKWAPVLLIRFTAQSASRKNTR